MCYMTLVRSDHFKIVDLIGSLASVDWRAMCVGAHTHLYCPVFEYNYFLQGCATSIPSLFIIILLPYYCMYLCTLPNALLIEHYNEFSYCLVVVNTLKQKYLCEIYLCELCESSASCINLSPIIFLLYTLQCISR